MNDHSQLSEEDIDYLTEIMNIAAGNAAGAICQMTHGHIEIKVPEINLVMISKITSLIDGPGSNATCVRMNMLGDVTGDLFFIVPADRKNDLIKKIQLASPAFMDKASGKDISALEELSNITAGVYLRALHDFCGLNIYHTVPCHAEDMLQSLLDESISEHSLENKNAFVVVNEFFINSSFIRFYLLLLPSFISIKTFINSIIEARRRLGIKEEVVI